MGTVSQTEFEDRLAACAGRVESLLRRLLETRGRDGEIFRPERLFAAMRHGALNGGKRLRPFLVVESAALFGAPPEPALRVAAAVECVHCYSLIHDDLPAMDDDDLRRGKPTVHRAFDEATAILAGDSLLTYAFDVIASAETALPDRIRVALVAALARAAGAGGMAGGQALDLEAEQDPPGEEGIVLLQSMKTGALIRFATEAGVLMGDAGQDDRDRMVDFGAAIGLAYQLADDLLDLTASTQHMGKATGKDAAAGKATLTALYGVEWSRKQLAGLTAQAQQLLEPYGERGDILRETARFIAERSR